MCHCEATPATIHRLINPIAHLVECYNQMRQQMPAVCRYWYVDGCIRWPWFNLEFWLFFNFPSFVLTNQEPRPRMQHNHNKHLFFMFRISSHWHTKQLYIITSNLLYKKIKVSWARRSVAFLNFLKKIHVHFLLISGIDLTQSPGRDSPGSSSGSGSGSRHSTASLDSGRASSYHTSSSIASKPSAYQPFSNPGASPFTNNSGILSSPRCSSVSSCSIGSADIHRTDHEIISDWLRELSMEEYAPLFSEAGYDMPTICRMTPEDLTAIGIKKPRHRERIKQHIDALQLPDNLPHFVPGSIEEWLRFIGLDEYIQPLLAQGYRQVRDVTQLPWEDMEDIGIVKLGHQKKLLLAIKRIKDILSGKWIAPGLANSPQVS